jgi:site-specific recombinase XerC
MTIVRVKGFKIFRDRHGKPRCYHRATGVSVDLSKAPIGSAEFLAECARISRLNELRTPASGSLGSLIAAYRESPAFLELAPRTRSDYQKIFNYLKDIDTTVLPRFNRPLIVKIRDKARRKGQRFANYLKAVLSTLFNWGRERGLVLTNPAEGIKNIPRKRGAPEANRPWSDDERAAVLDAAPAHMKAPIALMAFTGLGPKDALRLPRNYVRGGTIATHRSKTGEPVFWPIVAALAEILQQAPEHDAVTLCANSRGRPWTCSGFNASWRKVRARLEREGRVQSGLTLYGLRHTMAGILREMGRDERTIADALGQKGTSMARHYARRADLTIKMRDVAAAFDQEVNRRSTKTVKPDA